MSPVAAPEAAAKPVARYRPSLDEAAKQPWDRDLPGDRSKDTEIAAFGSSI